MPTLIPSNSRSVLFYSPPLSTHSNEVFTYLALWINIRTKLLSLQFKRDVGRTFFGSIMRLPNTNDKYICTIDQSCIITFTLFHGVLLFYTFHTNYNCSNIIDMQCFKELYFHWKCNPFLLSSMVIHALIFHPDLFHGKNHN